MTIGVGGSTAEAELAAMKNMRGDVPPIGVDERLKRIARAQAIQAIMREKGIDALYLDVSSSMTYFTGLKFRRTERMHSAVLPAKGEIVYISPAFEVEKLKTMLAFGDKIAVWEEDEDPTATVTETVRGLGYPSGTIAVDEATPFFTFDGLRRAGNAYTFVNSIDVTAGCRMIKSEQELALMQTAKNITLEAQKAAARIMREGITTPEVQAFLTAAHRRLGSEGDPPFNAVLFGEATAYPHGVPYPQTLKDGDMILTSRAPMCSANRPNASATSGTWRKQPKPRASLRQNPATAARTSTSPPAVSSTARASAPAMPPRACRTGPATASASTCTNGRIS